MENGKVMTNFDPPLDEGIKYAVELLNTIGIETYESCEGGEGHSYCEPTIRFHGDKSEGFRALALLLQNNLPVEALRRIWVMVDKELTGPEWEVVFWQKPEGVIIESVMPVTWERNNTQSPLDLTFVGNFTKD